MKKIEKKTIGFVVDNQLCISCGICKNMCPKNCISWKYDFGLYTPKIEEERCISCGICEKVCPSLKMEYESTNSPERAMQGESLMTVNAWSKNAEKRHKAASGGVISTLIPNLLEAEIYDAAFVVDSYSYSSQLQTKLKRKEDFEEDWENNKTPKSRYLPVSHEQAVEYLKRHRAERLIFVGTSCAIRGLSNVIKQLRLDREQYLFIGLFCDQVFQYNIVEYYRSEQFCQGKILTDLHFKNKESGGWPGNMKFHFSDGTSCYHDKQNRVEMKSFFMPERCLYCVDKLNIQADISLGDNYTQVDESPLGSNSVIIRTERGMRAWYVASDELEQRDISMEAITTAQDLSYRARNLQYAMKKEKIVLKKTGEKVELNRGINVQQNNDIQKKYTELIERLNAGRVYNENQEALVKQVKKANTITIYMRCRRLLSRCYRRVKRFLWG